MTTFLTSEIARLNHTDDYTYHEDLSEAVILERMGWTIFELRATPSHVIKRLNQKWTLDNELEKKRQRKSKS